MISIPYTHLKCAAYILFWDYPEGGLGGDQFQLTLAMPKSLNSPRHELVKSALVAQRRAVGMTQTEVAKRLGVPQSYVAKIEGGERRVDIVELIELARVIDLDVVDLVRKAALVSGR